MSDAKKNSSYGVKQSRSLVILGAGGHAVSVANVALSAGYEVSHFIDQNKKGCELLGYKIIESVDDLRNTESLSFAIAIGDNAAREKVYEQLIKNRPNLHFPPLVHSTAVISLFCDIGDGVVIMPNAVIGPNTKIGKFCLINTQASIDHDCEMLDYSSLAPGSVIGGAVKIGVRTALSIGTTVKHGLKIGNDCIVGANSYLNKDLPSNQVAYGTPAKQIRNRSIGDPYLA
jgi:sugar O-acyltransferase (sialic acid O-acetyltransferase NeuD family)